MTTAPRKIAQDFLNSEPLWPSGIEQYVQIVARALVEIDKVTGASGERSPWRKVGRVREILAGLDGSAPPTVGEETKG